MRKNNFRLTAANNAFIYTTLQYKLKAKEQRIVTVADVLHLPVDELTISAMLSIPTY